jgi:hypothetical protein
VRRTGREHRAVLADSTDGPIEHLKIGCLSKHWLIPLAEMVQAEQVATPDRDLAALPS